MSAPGRRRGRLDRVLKAAAMLVALATWLAPGAALAHARAHGVARRTSSAPATALSTVPSSTQPYAACPPPPRGYAACQSVVYPRGTRMRSLTPMLASPSSGIDESGLSPAELQSAYELPSSTAGAGQTVALVDAFDDPDAESDLAAYRTAYGLPACTAADGCFSKFNQNGGTEYPPPPTREAGDWNVEEALDMDMVSAVCPNCHIMLIETNNNSLGYLTAANNEAVDLGATEISDSWGEGEERRDTSFDADFDHPGVPITAASGDDGYDNYQLGEEVPSYPASSPYVIAVGGTELVRASDARGWSESVWPQSGSGCSRFERRPEFQKIKGCSRRTTNDVAAVAADLSIYNTGEGDQGWMTIGGTSASTPIIAAVEGLSESAEHVLGPAAFYRSPGSLFDITSGSNGGCVKTILCVASSGYDGPSGNGTPDGALSLAAAPPPPELAVRATGSGSGSIVSSPAGIDCPGTCSARFPSATRVTLTVSASPGSTFEGWLGHCKGTGACKIALKASTSITATLRASGTPAGWTEARLASPSGRQPFPSGSDTRGSFFNVALSASGEVRAKTIFDEPEGFCTYASSDTGGVFLERHTSSGWISEGELTAPAVGSDLGARWANCHGFGSVTELSADGSTLLVAPEEGGTSNPELGNRARCAVFVYRYTAGGWALDGTLFPPGVGPSGPPDGESCFEFGSEDAISSDGEEIAVGTQRAVDLFRREASGWSLEEQIALSPRELILHGDLALSGDGRTLLVGEAAREEQGEQRAGAVSAYTRGDSGWSLEQTILSPEPQAENEFGIQVAISNDGSTAAISSNGGAGLPRSAGAAWVFELDAQGWHTRTRLAASVPEEEALVDCPEVVGGGARIVCDAYNNVGFNVEQGSLYSFDRPPGGWSSSAVSSQHVFARDGLEFDDLGEANRFGRQQLAVSEDGGVVDAPISNENLATDLYPDNMIGYEFTAPPVYSTPTIASFSPSSGGAGTTVTITGGNLIGANAVGFDGTEASHFEVQSPTQMTATVPAGAGSGPISVTTPGGTGTSTESFSFLKPEGTPQVSSITPARGPTAGGTEVTINGSKFVPGSTVTIGGAASALDVRSESEITAVTQAEPAGEDEVIVSDEAGSSSGGPSYTYVAPPPRPVVNSINPAEGPTLGGSAVTIKGEHFQPGASVTIGGAASAVTVRSETEITADTPAEPAGSDEVIVNDEGGRSTGGPSYTYVVTLAVSSVTPSEGPTNGGSPVTITGSGFEKGAKVMIGGHSNLHSVDVRSETEITAVTRAEPAGSYEVVVSDKRGISTGGPTYSYVSEP